MNSELRMIEVSQDLLICNKNELNERGIRKLMLIRDLNKTCYLIEEKLFSWYLLTETTKNAPNIKKIKSIPRLHYFMAEIYFDYYPYITWKILEILDKVYFPKFFLNVFQKYFKRIFKKILIIKKAFQYVLSI